MNQCLREAGQSPFLTAQALTKQCVENLDSGKPPLSAEDFEAAVELLRSILAWSHRTGVIPEYDWDACLMRLSDCHENYVASKLLQAAMSENDGLCGWTLLQELLPCWCKSFPTGHTVLCGVVSLELRPGWTEQTFGSYAMALSAGKDYPWACLGPVPLTADSLYKYHKQRGVYLGEANSVHGAAGVTLEFMSYPWQCASWTQRMLIASAQREAVKAR